MEDTIQRLGKVFNIKVQKRIEEFIRCKIHKGIGEIFQTQRRIVQKLLNSNVEEEETIKYHYIGDQIDVGLIQVKFVKSEENLADLFTKNLKGELFECHSLYLVNGQKRQKGRVLEGKYNILSLSRT
jgi:hypothetical protein